MWTTSTEITGTTLRAPLADRELRPGPEIPAISVLAPSSLLQPTWPGEEGVEPGDWRPAVAVPGPDLHLVDTARLEVLDEIGLAEPVLLICNTRTVSSALPKSLSLSLSLLAQFRITKKFYRKDFVFKRLESNFILKPKRRQWRPTWYFRDKDWDLPLCLALVAWHL